MNLSLLAGFARRDITPPIGARLFGYAGNRAATQVDDPLAVSALVLRQGETSAVLVSLDWCLIDEAETAILREMAEAATGIPGRNITLSATHTHSGPTTVECWGWGRKDFDYLETVRPRIVEAIVAALDAAVTVKVGVGTRETDTGVNRREVLADGSVTLGFNEWGACDSRLTVVRFESENGPVAQIIHLGAHPTSRGQDPAISRDWPGVMQDRVEKITGAPVLLINGAFGDVAPRTTIGGRIGDGAAAAEEVGLRAALHAVQAWQSIKTFIDPPLNLVSAEFALPNADLPSLAEAETKRAEFAEDVDAPGYNGCEARYWSAVCDAHAAPRQIHPWSQTLTRIGPVVVVPFAGEVFAEIALRVRKASPFEHTLCAGTSNGAHGYYVTREARARGGYEVWVARAYSAYLLRDDIDDVLVAENLQLLRQMHGEAEPAGKTGSVLDSIG